MDHHIASTPTARRWVHCASLCALALIVAAVLVATRTTSNTAEAADGGPTKYVAVQPFRLVDTRSGIGVQQVDAKTWRVTVAGVGGVPAETSAVSVSMVALDATAPGYLLTYPTGVPLPNASNLNYEPGKPYSSGAIIPLSPGGQFDVYVHSPVQFIVDVTGAFVPSGATSAGRFVPLESSARAFDSRVGRPIDAGSFATVALPSNIPSDATAALITVTSTTPNSPGYFTAFTDGARPNTSALNVASSNSARATTAIWPVRNRSLNVYSSAGGHLIVDVIGFFTGASASAGSDGLFVPMTPVRRLDTRQSAPIGADQARSFPAAGGGVAIGSLTMVDPLGAGFATAWANGTPMPPTSSINLTDGYVIANLTVTRVTSDGAAVYSSTTSHYLFDQFGYFTNATATATVPLSPDRPPSPPSAPAPVPPSSSGCSVSALLVPSCGVWFGATTPARSGVYDYERGLAEYEAVAQNTPDILHFYKTGPARFPTSTEAAMAQRPGLQRSLLLYNWKPSSRYTWRQSADGAADAEIATIAASIKAYPHKLLLNIYHEPEDNVNPSAGSGMTAQDYAAMYRRVVNKLREAGVTNAVLVWNVMGYSGWRQYLDALYPGDQYVDWLAYDPYARNDVFDDLVDLVNRGRPELGWPGYYSWATSKAPGKPIMWAEWGVDLSTNRNPTAMISIDPNVIADRYPMLKAIVYWHQVGVGNYRLDDNTNLGRSFGTAFRQLANHPVFNATTPNAAP